MTRQKVPSSRELLSDEMVCVVIAGASAAFALGQASALGAGRADSATQSSASIPDFSGIWAHPGLGFGPPLSGPGPVRNKVRLPSGAGNFDQLVGDYTDPILKPEAAEIVKKRGEISLSGHAFPDPDNQCLQNPVPYIFWNFDIELLHQPNKVTIIDRNYRGKGLQLEFTVEDKGVFTMPWSATQTYLRAARTTWDERICAENVGHYYESQYYSDKDAHIPTADKPDF